jgi:signal transduction histidine kinase
VVGRLSVEGLTIRAALLIGFGLTLGLWFFAGYHLAQEVEAVQRDRAAVARRYVQAQERLAIIRTQVLAGSVSVRDALLDASSSAVQDSTTKVTAAHRTLQDALEAYVPVLGSSEEQAQLSALRRAVIAFHATMLEILSSDRDRWLTDARRLLQERVAPTREEVLRTSEEVQALNRGAFVRQESGATAIYTATQRRVWGQFGFAMAASLAIALLATLYATRLEGHLRRQHVQDAQNRRDLEHLSAQLIKAQEEERRTIARELHDEVGQALTAVKVEIAVAKRAAHPNEAAVHALDSARGVTEGALQTVRDLSRLLRPALLDDLGLAAALDLSLRDFGTRHRIRTDLQHIGMDDRLSPETEIAIYRIVQEALTNVAKHAHASVCSVRLERRGDDVRVTIEDDGVGFQPGPPSNDRGDSGLGLIGIRERVSQLRGTLDIDSVPGRGTRLTVQVATRAAAPGLAASASGHVLGASSPRTDTE